MYRKVSMYRNNEWVKKEIANNLEYSEIHCITILEIQLKHNLEGNI